MWFFFRVSQIDQEKRKESRKVGFSDTVNILFFSFVDGYPLLHTVL